MGSGPFGVRPALQPHRSPRLVHGRGRLHRAGAHAQAAAVPSNGATKQTAGNADGLLPAGAGTGRPINAWPSPPRHHAASAHGRTLMAALSVGLLLPTGEAGQLHGQALAGALAAALALAAWPLAVHLGASRPSIITWGPWASSSAPRWRPTNSGLDPTRRLWPRLGPERGAEPDSGLPDAVAMAVLPLALAWPRERRAWSATGLSVDALAPGGLRRLGLRRRSGELPEATSARWPAVDHADLPDWLQRIAPLYSLAKVFRARPPFALGALGPRHALLPRLPPAAPLSPLGAAALALVLGGMDVFRQRQIWRASPIRWSWPCRPAAAWGWVRCLTPWRRVLAQGPAALWRPLSLPP